MSNPTTSCDRVAILLVAVADNEATMEERAELEAHVRHCQQCAYELRAEQQHSRRLRKELRTWLDHQAAAPSYGSLKGRSAAGKRWRSATSGLSRTISATTVLLVMLGLIVTMGLLLRAQSRTRHTADSVSGEMTPAVIYGTGSVTLASGDLFPGYLFALEVPSGRLVGQFSPGFAGQGGLFVISPDGQRGYFFAGQELNELALPSLRLLHSEPVPNGINILGIARIVAVGPDGQHVYLETMDKPGDPTSEYGIAVYDVAAGAFTGQIPLQHPRCEVANLYPLDQEHLAVLCNADHQVRIVDLGTGQQLPGSLPVNGGDAILVPGSQRLLVVSGSGQIQDVDLGQLVINRSVNLALPCSYCVPPQLLHLSSDGQRLVLVAAPGPPELRSNVNATVAWIVDTNTLTRVAEIPVGPHTADAFEYPGGQALVTSRIDLSSSDGSALRLVAAPSGQELADWPGSVSIMDVRAAPGSP